MRFPLPTEARRLDRHCRPPPQGGTRDPLLRRPSGGGRLQLVVEWKHDRAADRLDRFELYHLRNDYGSDISGGQKRLLELARPVMAEPKLMLLDEPMADINPALIERVCKHLEEIQGSGVTLLMIEHNLSV